MRRIPVGIGAIMATLVIALSGCGDRPLPFEPDALSEAPRPFFSQEPAAGVDVLRRTKALKRDERRSMMIGARGGAIKLKKAGAVFVVPRGALTERVRITVTAPAGDAVAFTFAPHGLGFLRPATLRVSLEGTNAVEAGFSSFFGVYFTGEVGGSVTPLEVFRPGLVGTDALLEIEHFSGYALAGG